MAEFEFVVEGPPCTANQDKGKPKNDWKQRVGRAAYAKWIADGRSADILPLKASLEVNVTTYCNLTLYDVDNVLKWTLDGLKPVEETKPKNVPRQSYKKNAATEKLAGTYQPIYADDQLIFKVTSERRLVKGETNPSTPIVDQALLDFNEFLHIVIRWNDEEKNDADKSTKCA